MVTRFSKGTTDHDGDGHMGGSRKEMDMSKPTAKRASKPAAEAEAPKVKLDPQSGQEGAAESVKPAQAQRKAAVKAQFDEADAKADPAQQAIAEATLSRSVRGW